jgi:ribosomal protein S1
MPVGKEVTARVIKIEASDRKIALSVKAYEENLDASMIEENSELEGAETSPEESQKEINKSKDTSKEEANETNKAKEK